MHLLCALDVLIFGLLALRDLEVFDLLKRVWEVGGLNSVHDVEDKGSAGGLGLVGQVVHELRVAFDLLQDLVDRDIGSIEHPNRNQLSIFEGLLLSLENLTHEFERAPVLRR